MNLLKKLGVVSGIGAGTFAALSYKPKFVPTPSSIVNHSFKWNPNHHQTVDDTFEVIVEKENVKKHKDDLLLSALKGYFSSNVFGPQRFIVNKFMKDPNTTRRELWDVDNWKREELQPGHFLFNEFEILEVESNKVWLRFPIGAVMMEIEDKGKDALVRMSGVIWNAKEDVKPASLALFYAHCAYQRMLMQGLANNM